MGKGKYGVLFFLFLGGDYNSAVAIRKARKFANGYRSPPKRKTVTDFVCNSFVVYTVLEYF